MVRHIDAASPATRASMLFDLLTGNRLELDALIGVVIRRARAHRMSVPILATLYALLKPYEVGPPTNGYV